MKTNKKNNGYTLFEFLVVAFIIALISSVLITNWRRGEQQYKLQAAAQEMVQNIRRVQEMALAGVEHNGQIPQNYGIYFEVGSISYTMFSENSNDGKYDKNSDPMVGDDSILVGGGLEISDIIACRPSGCSNPGEATNISIVFTLPFAKTSMKSIGLTPPQRNSTTITFNKVGAVCPSTNCRYIIIKDTGEISVQ